MSYTIAKIDLPPQPVLLVKRRVSRSEIGATIGEALPLIFQFAQAHGIPLTGPPLTRYSEMNGGLLTIESAMRVAATAPAAISGEGEVVFDTLPGGPAATTTHVGPYETLGNAYAALQQWIAAEGLTPGGNPWECYITDPGQVPDPNDWKTDIVWPLAR